MSEGNAYPAVALDARGQIVDSMTAIQFTDGTDQPGSGGGSQPSVTDGTTTIDAPALIEIAGSTLTGDSTEAVFTLALPPILSGGASPLNTVDPPGTGALYIATNTGGLWIATGITSADWVTVGGEPGGLGVGVVSGAGQVALVGSTGPVQITDLAAEAGNSNGLKWNSPGADGTQYLTVQVGDGMGGFFTHTWAADGTYTGSASIASTGGLAAFGVTPPASQPATPVLLADVIAILQGAGLCA